MTLAVGSIAAGLEFYVQTKAAQSRGIVLAAEPCELAVIGDRVVCLRRGRSSPP